MKIFCFCLQAPGQEDLGYGDVGMCRLSQDTACTIMGLLHVVCEMSNRLMPVLVILKLLTFIV